MKTQNFNLAFFCAVCCSSHLSAAAAVMQVTSLSDSGAGTLRQAMTDANSAPGNDVIEFAVSGTITIYSPLPAITSSITITGPGTNLLTVSGNNSVPIFTVTAGTNRASISGVTIANGRATGYANGAGLANAGSLIISNCAFVNNRTFGGWGGGIFNSGYLTIINSRFSGNQVVGEDGANLNGNVLNAGGGGAGMGGGLFCLSGNLTISGCAFIDNSATGGNGGGGATVGNGRGGGLNGGPGKQQDSYSGNGANGGFGGGGGGSGNLIFEPPVIGGSGGFGGGGGGSPQGMTGGQAGFGGGTGGVQVDWNCCGSAGGGGAGLGGGIFVASGNVWIRGNGTFSGNQAFGGIGGGNTQGHGSNGSGIGPDLFNMAGNIQPVLTATTLGGGTLVVTPSTPPYLNNNSLATITATPSPGWTLVHWLGDAGGTNSTLNLSVTRNKFVQAIFATPVTVSALASAYPQATLYPYGSMVKLTALPPNGLYFSSWSGDAAGTNNPMNIVVTNANRNITALFGGLGAGQFSLTVIESGKGRVSRSQTANTYTNNELVTLNPIPDTGQAFIDWNGDANGTNIPLFVTMNTSKTITANFTKRPSLRVGTTLEGLVEEGFRLTLTGEFGEGYQILSSTNLGDWIVAGSVTNKYGTVQLTDGEATNSSARYYRAAQ